MLCGEADNSLEMPYSGASDPKLPANVQKMSAKARERWVATFNSVMSDCEGEDCESKAFAVANGTAKRARLGPFDGVLTLVKRQADGRVLFRTTCSDDGVDKYATRMTTDLHEDFIRNAEGAYGMPFLTVAHYNQLCRIGRVENLYRDGRRLKAEGHFFTDDPDPVIRKIAETAASRALDEASLAPNLRTIRTSIGFYPLGSEQEDLGVTAYTKGYLPEIALTTFPGNSRADFAAGRRSDMATRAINPELMMRDAASILGDELAEELNRRLRATMEGRSGEADDVLTLLYRSAVSQELAQLRAEGKLDEETYEEAIEALVDRTAPPAPDPEPDKPTPPPAPAPETTGVRRSGRRLAGKKLSELTTAIDALTTLRDWAAKVEEEAPADEGADVEAEGRSVDLGDATTREAIFTAALTLADNAAALKGASDPEAALDRATTEFRQTVMTHLTATEADNSLEMPQSTSEDVKPKGMDTGSVNPEGASPAGPDLQRYAAAEAQLRQAILDNDRVAIQASLEGLVPAIEEDLTEGAPAPAPVDDTVLARIAGVEMMQERVLNTLDDIVDRLNAQPAPEPETRSFVPRRRSYSPGPPPRSASAPVESPRFDPTKPMKIGDVARLTSGIPVQYP